MESEFLSKPLEEVGVMGLVMGLEDGESLCSFDRIFFRKPRVGIERAPGGDRGPLLSKLGSTNSKPVVNSALLTREDECRLSRGQRTSQNGSNQGLQRDGKRIAGRQKRGRLTAC